MTVEMVQAIATVLDVPVSSLLGETDTRMTESVQKTFILRLLSVLRTEESNVSEFYGTSQPYSDVIDGSASLTIEVAEKIADELGVTLDYLTGRTDEPNESTTSLLVDQFAIAKDYAAGKITEVWNPKKIGLIREFLEDNEPTIQKLLALSFPSPHSEQEVPDGEHQED